MRQPISDEATFAVSSRLRGVDGLGLMETGDRLRLGNLLRCARIQTWMAARVESKGGGAGVEAGM